METFYKATIKVINVRRAEWEAGLKLKGENNWLDLDFFFNFVQTAAYGTRDFVVSLLLGSATCETGDVCGLLTLTAVSHFTSTSKNKAGKVSKVRNQQ